LGIDPGLANTGWALLSGGDLIDFGCVRTKKSKRTVTGGVTRRLMEVSSALRPLLRSSSVAVVEWPGGGFGKNARSAVQTNLVAGLVVGLATASGTTLLQPSPRTWRAQLGSKSGADSKLHKNLYKRFSSQLERLLLGELPHVLDAIGLATYGEAL